jgi:PLP dependent protein
VDAGSRPPRNAGSPPAADAGSPPAADEGVPRDAGSRPAADPHPSPDPAEIAGLAAARAAVLSRIAAACSRVGRDPAGVTLVAVSKTVAPERLRAAVAAGYDVLGENRVQEAAAKIPLVPGARWHLVGPLQANKARRAIELFDVLEAVHSVDLACRLDRLTGEIRPARLSILLEVNVDADPAKAGLLPGAVADALPELLALPNLEIRGLMTIGRLVATAEEARATFAALRMLAERLRAAHPGFGPDLSMGMTDDYEVAVEEGATIVRVGRALFGERAGPPDRRQPPVASGAGRGPEADRDAVGEPEAPSE